MQLTKLRLTWLIAKVLLTFFMLMSGSMQLLFVDMMRLKFEVYGFPEHFVRFLGAMKILGAIGIWVPLSKEIAYTGFIFVCIGAVYTHLIILDPLKEFVGIFIAITLLSISILLERKNNTPNLTDHAKAKS